ncbi:MAG: VOC family protein [Actinobacteria bacterium]|nr:VOC family protein [Actinomycetota bacterium]
MTNAPSVWPGLLCTDARATIRFLVEAFGFVETIIVPGEQEGEIMHAEVRWPEGGIVMIGSDDRRGEFADHNRPGTNSLYVVTDHPDEVFARATAAGAQVVRPMRDEDYGSRGFTVLDPEGNLWSFGTYRGA